MIKEIRLPDLGEGIDSAVVSEVPLGAGESVTKDDVLLVLESDKASMEIPSDHTGKIVDVLVNEGDDISTNDLLFKIEVVDDGSTPEPSSEELDVSKEPDPKPDPKLRKGRFSIYFKTDPSPKRLINIVPKTSS